MDDGSTHGYEFYLPNWPISVRNWHSTQNRTGREAPCHRLKVWKQNERRIWVVNNLLSSWFSSRLARVLHKNESQKSTMIVRSKVVLKILRKCYYPFGLKFHLASEKAWWSNLRQFCFKAWSIFFVDFTLFVVLPIGKSSPFSSSRFSIANREELCWDQNVLAILHGYYSPFKSTFISLVKNLVKAKKFDLLKWDQIPFVNFTPLLISFHFEIPSRFLSRSSRSILSTHEATTKTRDWIEVRSKSGK